MSGFTFGFKKRGRFRTGSALQEKLERHMTPPLRSAGRIIVNSIKAVTPVRTGYLKRSTDMSPPIRKGNVYKINVEVGAPYGKYVNRRGRHRGYQERGFKAGAAQARRVLGEGAKDMPLDVLWVSE